MRLASPLDAMRASYDAVVVGTGYGGSIAAARLARAGRSVCVLERGIERQPGEYPDSLVEGARSIRVETAHAEYGSPAALFDFHVGRDISVVVGSGLGGTSQINAGVALRPKPWVFDDKRWPTAIRSSHGAVLGPYYDRAKHMLGSTPYPDDWPTLAKLEVLGQAALAVHAKVERPPINVTFKSGPNAVGVNQNECTLCGDCVSGCNDGAKNTLIMNYLPEAKRHGAEIFCSAAVRTVSRRDDGKWIVKFDMVGEGRARFDAPGSFVIADVVVLAAGTLGSTEILLRSRDAGLPVSTRVGAHVTGNGDLLGFAYDTDHEVDGIGYGAAPVDPTRPVGPCIAGMIDLTERPKQDKGVLLEEGAIPGVLGPLIPSALAIAANAFGDKPKQDWRAALLRRLKELASVLDSPHAGPAARTLTYLVMSTDDDRGRLRLDDDRVRLDWHDIGKRPVFRRASEVLDTATEALGATEVDVLDTSLGSRGLVTVHPLGGCVMGDDAEEGVVDDRCRVFDQHSGQSVHEGLYVMDGSVVPRPLTVNPLLTISALTERACELLIEDRGWDAAPAPAAPLDGDIAHPGIQLTERMRGWCSTAPTTDFAEAEILGRRAASSIEFVLTVRIDDIAALARNTARVEHLSGTLVAPILSPRPLAVVNGRFQLLERDATQVETWNMRYKFDAVADDDRTYHFDGFKVVRSHSAIDAWHDTTTLYVTITEPPDDSEEDPDHAPVVARGIMHIGVADFVRQQRTVKVIGPSGVIESVRWKGRFNKAFLGSLTRIYGGPLNEAGRFPSTLPKPPPLDPTKGRRPRALPEPEIRWIRGDGTWTDSQPDDAWLRLVRFKGGNRRPVMLASGFGMSASSFVLDTVETNLAEALVAREHDVWLFDYRASIDLPSSKTQFTIDDIALHDWPAGIAEVRRVTGADEVNAMGHCVGSVSLLMTLLVGTQGVKSVIAGQFTVHPQTSLLNRIKAALDVGHILGEFGVKTVAPDSKFSVPNVLLDLGLRLVPMPAHEHCGQAVCRWINAIYGCTHHHGQLDDATHKELNALFGVGNAAALNHLGLMMKRRRAVDHTGNDPYLPNVERLALPILLLQGKLNYIFHPSGSAKTLKWLQKANGRSFYERRVLDDYAHLDTLIGKNAARDVYGAIADRFEKTGA